MDIQVQIEVADQDIADLQVALGCTPQDFQDSIRRHVRAAINEYLESYVGRRVFSRGSDILEHRLALLIEHAFGNHIPKDAEVARLFQMPLTRSRSLLKSTLSKYRYQLQPAIATSARQMLEAAVWWPNPQEYRVDVQIASLVDLLNQRLAALDGVQKPITPIRESVATYSIAPGSYDLLCNAFGANPVPR